jgi:hypothetical protein
VHREKIRTQYVHQLTDEHTATYSLVPMNCLRTSVTDIFLSFGTEEYSLVIFLGTKEYTKNEEDTLFYVVINNMIE